MRSFYAAIALNALLATTAFAGPADAILDANKTSSGGKAWDNKATLRYEMGLSGQGLTGKATYMADLVNGRFAGNFTVGPAGGGNGYDGTHAWAQDFSGAVTMQDSSDDVRNAVSEAYRDANMWWHADRGGATVTSGGQKTDGGVTYDVVTVAPKDGKPFDCWFEAKTHLLSRMMEKQGAQTITSTFSDYRAVDGAMLAGKTVIDDGEGPKYLQTLTLASAKFMPAQDISAYAAPKVTVTDFSIAGSAPEATLPIKVINNHIYAEATVNGKGPYTVIFDTGGSNLVTPTVAKELGLKSEGHMDAHGAGEGVMEVGLTKVDEIKLGKATVKNQVFIVLPLDAMSDVEGLKEKAMVGFEVARRFVTRIDYAGHTLTLIDPKHFDPKDAGTPVKFAFRQSIPEVKGTFEGIPGMFDIDTGSRVELTLTKPFAEKNSLRAKHPKGVEGVDGWGIGGPSRGYVTRGAMLTMGDVKVPNVVTTLSTQAKGAFAGEEYSGNIGSGLLKRFIVTFDYEHQIMYLKPATAKLTDIGTFDRAGMWINDSQGGFKVVDVTAKSPADEAGLKAGDVIVLIDGKLAGEATLPDLRVRLRNDPPGTKIKLGMQNGKMVTLTLRDQI